MTVPDTEFNQKFVDAMKARMAVSYYKYGPVAQGYPHRVDALASLAQRLECYRQTGNAEYLMDAANFAMIEFMHPAHPNAHFTPTDSDGSPGRITRNLNAVSYTHNKDAIPVDSLEPLEGE